MVKCCYKIYNNITKEWYLGPMCAGDEELRFGVSEQLKQRPDFPLYNFEYWRFGELDVSSGEFCVVDPVKVDLSDIIKR